MGKRSLEDLCFKSTYVVIQHKQTPLALAKRLGNELSVERGHVHELLPCLNLKFCAKNDYFLARFGGGLPFRKDAHQKAAVYFLI